MTESNKAVEGTVAQKTIWVCDVQHKEKACECKKIAKVRECSASSATAHHHYILRRCGCGPSPRQRPALEETASLCYRSVASALYDALQFMIEAPSYNCPLLAEAAPQNSSNDVKRLTRLARAIQFRNSVRMILSKSQMLTPVLRQHECEWVAIERNAKEILLHLQSVCGYLYKLLGAVSIHGCVAGGGERRAELESIIEKGEATLLLGKGHTFPWKQEGINPASPPPPLLHRISSMALLYCVQLDGNSPHTVLLEGAAQAGLLEAAQSVFENFFYYLVCINTITSGKGREGERDCLECSPSLEAGGRYRERARIISLLLLYFLPSLALSLLSLM